MGRSRDILLTLIVCLLAALCIMDLFNKKQTIKEKTNQTEPEQETVETLEKDDPLVTQLLDLISYDQTAYVLAQHSTVQFELVNQFPDDVKLMMAYLNANESDKTVLNTTTYDSSSMSFVYDNNDFTQVIQGGSYAIKSIPEDTMKRLVEEIFGDNSYHPANFAPNYGNYMTIFFYNPTRKEYVEYESGTKDIPVSVLHSMSKKYGIELTTLISGGEPHMHSYFLTKKDKGISVERRADYRYQSLAYGFMNRKAEPFMVTITPEDTKEIHFNSHPGHEFNYMIEGSMRIIVDGKEMILEEGDSLYFDSTKPHGMQAMNGKNAKFLAIII